MPSAVRNIEFGIDDDDLTIVPTPAYNFTAYGLSLFISKYGNHLWNRSMSRRGRCFQFVEVGYTLPEGLAVVYDGQVRLNCWDSKEDHRLEKRSGREQFLHHYSPVATARMSESEYRTKLSEAFSTPHVMPRAEESADVRMPEWRGRRACVDGGVLAIADAAELYIETAKLLSPAFALDIILLYQLVTDDIAPVSSSRTIREEFDTLQTGTQSQPVTNGTPTYPMIRLNKQPTWRSDSLIDSVKRQLSFSEIEYGQHVGSIHENSPGVKNAILDLYKPYGGIAVTVIEAHSIWANVAFDGNREDIPPLKLWLAGAEHVADFHGQVTGWLDKEEPSVVVGSSSSSRLRCIERSSKKF
ncbi:hypothetical protein HDU88_005402 [Geranomyces variabilis]|nr:hypothetical protein HDU88_005402 [Geranomyces variabilis]